MKARMTDDHEPFGTNDESSAIILIQVALYEDQRSCGTASSSCNGVVGEDHHVVEAIGGLINIL